MKCHKLTCQGRSVLYATGAEARRARQTIVDQTGAKKSSVTIEQHDVPTAKAELLVYINELLDRVHG